MKLTTCFSSGLRSGRGFSDPKLWQSIDKNGNIFASDKKTALSDDGSLLAYIDSHHKIETWKLSSPKDHHELKQPLKHHN
ncbi:MAG TPA: hypothetical protein VGK22_23065 [Candidatus Angelobacter sp.]